MQKKKYMIYTVLCAALVFTASCSHQPIFWAIEKEIKLLDPSIRGNVHSVVRSDNFLYTANGLVHRQPLKTERSWEEISKPDGFAAYLASSTTHVYVLSVNDDGYRVYSLAASGGEWKKVENSSGKAVVIFDNGVSGSGRVAYVRIEKKVYKLDGENRGPEQNSNGAGASTVAAAHAGSHDYFADTKAFCSNGTTLYKGIDKKITYGTDHTTSAGSIGTGEKITCLTYDKAGNRLIVGTKKGLEEIKLSATGVAQSAGNLGSNAEAALGEYEVFSVSCFADDDNNAIYAGVGKTKNSKNNALWGYYPSRDNWNYE